MTQYHHVPASIAICWPSISINRYHFITHHIVTQSWANWIFSLFTAHLIIHEQYNWSSFGYKTYDNKPIPGQIWAEKFSRSVSKDFKRKKVCSLQSAAFWYRWKCTTAPGSSDNSYVHRPPLLNWQILRKGGLVRSCFSSNKIYWKLHETWFEFWNIYRKLLSPCKPFWQDQISHRFWEGWPNLL